MTKAKKDVDISKADRIKSPGESYRPNGRKNTSPRERKVLLPPKQGTVSRAVIRKAIREIIKERTPH